MEKTASNNWLYKLCKIQFYLGAFGTFLLMMITFCDVLSRYCLGFSLTGAIELTEILTFMILFLGIPLIQYNEEHICVDLIFNRFSNSWKICIKLAISLITCCTGFAIIWYLYASGLDKYIKDEYTAALFIRLYIPCFIAAIQAIFFTLASLLCILHYASDLYNLAKHLFIPAVLIPSLLFSLPFFLHGTEFADDYFLIGVLYISLLMLLIFLRLPIALAMIVAGVLGMMTISMTPMKGLDILLAIPSSTMTYTYSVIPMFILMGEFVLHSGISEELFNVCSIWLGARPGGMASASLCGCAGFSAICGDSLATALTMTSVALPEMKKHNYDPAFASACLSAGGTLGILIPPSVGFIFYAIVTEVSIGKLFLAGFLPGATLLILFCLMTYIISVRHPELAPRGPKSTWEQKIKSLYGLIPMIVLVIFMLFGMFGGLFSPTEAGAVGAAGTMLYALARRRLPWDKFLHSLKNATDICVKTIFILLGVTILGSFMATTQLPFLLSDMIQEMEANKYLVLFFIVVMYIILGCLFNVVPMMLLTLPAIFPTVQALGFDPVWFGVITVLLMEMGQITPPVGIIVFAISSMPGSAPMGSIFRRVMPFVICILIAVIIMTIFPEIALVLPNNFFSAA